MKFSEKWHGNVFLKNYKFWGKIEKKHDFRLFRKKMIENSNKKKTFLD